MLDFFLLGIFMLSLPLLKKKILFVIFKNT
jgi:hypothetical protein